MTDSKLLLPLNYKRLTGDSIIRNVARLNIFTHTQSFFLNMEQLCNSHTQITIKIGCKWLNSIDDSNILQRLDEIAYQNG